MTGELRKFAEPNMLAAASSPLGLPGEDPVVRRGVLNRGTLRPDKFVFNVAKLNAVNFFCRGLVIPGLNVLPAIVNSPTHDIPVPGDKLMFDPLVVRMAIAEDFENYLEIQRWLRGTTAPETHAENRALLKGWNNKEVSDASVSIFTNAGSLEQIRFHFKDAFPIGLEGIDLAPERASDEVLMAVTFHYSMYTVERVPEGEPS